MVSTISSAGWPAASIARRTAAMSEVTPVEVSLCTTHTALILLPVSWRSRASIMSACTPRRQLGAFGNSASSPCQASTSQARPRRVASLCHNDAKWPVSYINTVSPGLSVLTSAASHAPVPEAG